MPWCQSDSSSSCMDFRNLPTPQVVGQTSAGLSVVFCFFSPPLVDMKIMRFVMLEKKRPDASQGHRYHPWKRLTFHIFHHLSKFLNETHNGPSNLPTIIFNYRFAFKFHGSTLAAADWHTPYLALDQQQLSALKVSRWLDTPIILWQ